MPISELHKSYLEYIGSSDYSISEESAQYLYDFVKEHKIKSVLDLGSGFSTHIFALAGAKVYSIDTDSTFLQKTAKWLDQHNLKAEFYLFKGLPEKPKKWQLVFYDLGDFETRKANIYLPLERASKFVIYDDMDNPDYQALLAEKGIEVSVVPATLDGRGRYMGVVKK